MNDAAERGDGAGPAGGAGRAVDGTVEIDVAPFTGDLSVHRDELIELWIAVTHAGGAVGFRGHVTATDVAPAADELIAAVADGSSSLVAAFRDGVVVGIVAVAPGPAPRMAHRVTLGRLMVHPTLQGLGVGARLVAVAHQLARDRHDAEIALVAVRDGLDLDRFYLAVGYEEYGRIPGGLAFEDGDRVDEVFFLHHLRSPS